MKTSIFYKSVLSMILSFSFRGASSAANNNIFAELGGNGLLYSVNYERELFDSWYGRLGVGYISSSAKDLDNNHIKASAVTLPLMVSKMFGDGDHKFELGIGGTIVSVSASIKADSSDLLSGAGTRVVATGTIGYRYMPKDSGVMFKAGITPWYSNGNFFPGVGIGLGYSF